MDYKLEFDFKQVDVLGIHAVEYKSLHNQLFKGAAVSSEWIAWYHRDIGSLKKWSIGTRTWGVFCKGQLVGIWSVEPKNLRNGKKIMNVGRCFAVGIHEDFRRHGLFVALSEFAIAEERKLMEFDYILGFPQKGRSVIGGHLKAGWEEVQSIDIYSKRNEVRNFGLPRFTANVIHSFDHLDPSQDVDGIVEDAVYQNLRWINHPDHHYIAYKKSNAIIVLKVYSNFCHIVDLAGDVEGVKDLLKVVQSLAIRHGWIEVNVWCAKNEKYKKVIEEAGYKQGAEFGLPITMIAVKISNNQSLVIKDCTFQMGIEEGY